MSLVDKLGSEYIGEFFRNALFMRNNRLCMIRGCSPTRVDIMSASLDNPESQWESGTMPKDELESFKTIAWPKLGYRNMQTGNRGNLVAFVTSQRSVQRGLRAELLDWKHVDVVNALGMSIHDYSPSGDSLYQLRQLFKPTFYKFSEGIKQIKAGKWCSFAISEDVAVAVCSDSKEGFCDILFRDKKVGSVDEAGDITLSNKTIKRSALRGVLT